MNNTYDRQIGALGLCAFSVPAILFLPQTGWGAVLAVTVGSLLVVTFGKAVGEGNVTGTEKLLSIPIFLWNVVILGKLAWEISKVQRVDSLLPGLLLLLLGAYGVKKKVIPTVGAVLMFFIIGTYGVLYLFAFPDVRLEKLIPAGEQRVQGLAYGFLPILQLYMYKGSEKRLRFYGLGVGIALAIGAAVITAGMGAPDFYTASMSVNLFGAMERLEPFVGAVVTAGGFCLIGMLFQLDENIWHGIWNMKKTFPLAGILVPAIVGLWMAPRMGNKIFDIGTTLCWGVFPIITQLVVSKKKVKKYKFF